MSKFKIVKIVFPKQYEDYILNTNIYWHKLSTICLKEWDEVKGLYSLSKEGFNIKAFRDLPNWRNKNTLDNNTLRRKKYSNS